MTAELTDKKIAFLVANEGIEQVELTEPWKAVEAAGGQPFLVAPEGGTAQALNHLEAADTFEVDRTTAEIQVEEFDGVDLPGGVANPDALRVDEPATPFPKPWDKAARNGRTPG